MAIYPFTSPIILNDTVFINYGGHTGTSTAVQRQAVYTIAEKAVSAYISTLLLPVTVTGTFYFRPNDPYLLLDYGYVSGVDLVRFIDTEGTIYFTSTGTASIYASLRDARLGILDIWQWVSACNCSNSLFPFPYQVQVVYGAGLPTGIASNHPDILLALTIHADMVLSEMIGYGNEAPGLVGVSEYSNQGYREVRYGLQDTDFGSSPKAKFIKNLLEQWTVRRYVRW